MSANEMKWLKQFKALSAFKKRGIIYGLVGVIGFCAEWLLNSPPRKSVLLLWSGLIVIAVLVFFILREPNN